MDVLRKHLFISLSAHVLLLGLLLTNFHYSVTPKIYYEVQLYQPRGSTGAHGGTRTRSLFGIKSPYELSKHRDSESTGHGGASAPTSSDGEEIERYRKDDESRPAYNKKEVIFKSYIDQFGEMAVNPWFREVEKVVRSQRVFRDRTFTTSVIVIINKQGEAVRTVIAEGSGNLQMDLAVKNAFLGLELAHPPTQLIDSDGFGRLHYWFEMYLDLDLNKKGKFHLYRTD